MQEYNTIIGKLLNGVNRRLFKRIVDKYNGDFAVKKLSCWEQFVAVFLGQISNSKSLREIVDLIKFHSNQQYHLGIKKDVARSTLASANEKRDWRIYRELFFNLVNKYKNSKFYETKQLIEIIDSSPIHLDLKQHKWAERTVRAQGLKLHLIHDLENNIPVYFDITGARTNDINVAKKLEIEKDKTYVVDKGYTDYNWWWEINQQGAYFVTRLKRNAKIKNISEVQKANEEVSSQLFVFTNRNPRAGKINEYANIPLRKVIVQREGKNPLILVTNDFKRSDEEIAYLYKKRWEIELFFKWIKQNLKIKKFLGKTENAIKTQICIALISFVLLRIMEELKEICLEISAKNLLKIIGNSLFNCLKLRDYGRKRLKNPNQLQFEWNFAT